MNKSYFQAEIRKLKIKWDIYLFTSSNLEADLMGTSNFISWPLTDLPVEWTELTSSGLGQAGVSAGYNESPQHLSVLALFLFEKISIAGT